MAISRRRDAGEGKGAPPHVPNQGELAADGGGQTMSLAAAVVRTARPRQWVKNVLVLAAPGAAGVLTHGQALGRSLLAFALFCLASSGTYFVNDAADADADRLHPTKRNRPIAAGALGVGPAVAIGLVAMVASIAIAVAAGRSKLAVVIAVYIGVTLAYSVWLKHQPIFDIAAVAAGFVLRAIAGGVAAGVPLSNWFLIVASSGSMLMVSGKRHAEHVELGDSRGEHRATLAAYSLPFLRFVRSVSSSVAMTAYFLWAFEKAGSATALVAVQSHTQPSSHGALWFELSVIPFALAILRYVLLLDAGQGGAPEEIVLGDRTLQILGVALVAMFAIGIYVS
jgi:decaprenyl-phosphate phosphoribosyltransferase